MHPSSYNTLRVKGAVIYFVLVKDSAQIIEEVYASTYASDGTSRSLEVGRGRLIAFFRGISDQAEICDCLSLLSLDCVRVAIICRTTIILQIKHSIVGFAHEGFRSEKFDKPFALRKFVVDCQLGYQVMESNQLGQSGRLFYRYIAFSLVPCSRFPFVKGFGQ